jgi:RNA polymerase sigma-70 factor (ECF subfamily)
VEVIMGTRERDPATGEIAPIPVDRTTPVSFDEVYAAHFGRLVAQLSAYTGSVEQARDVVQEAFARALPRWSRVSTYDDPSGWVHRVAWNLATSQWRKLRTAHRYVRAYREVSVPGPNPDRVLLERALATLPANQRRAVVLHYLGDEPVARIAAQMQVSENTVKSWLHRGRQALLAQLSEKREARDA